MENISVNLSHTPGICYAIAYFISFIMYACLNKRKIEGIRFIGTLAGFCVLLGSFMLVTDNLPVVWFIPCIMFVFCLMMLFFYVCCEMNFRKIVYFSIRAFFLGEFAASLEWQLLYFGLNSWKLSFNIFWNLVFIIVCHGGVFGTLYFIEKRYKNENEQLNISGKQVWVSVFIGVIVFTLSNISYLYYDTPFSSKFTSEIFIIRTLVDLGGVGMLFAHHIQVIEMEVRQENKYLQNILHMQYENFKVSEESVAIVNQKYHDLKHQIEVLRNTSNEEEKIAYLDEMEKDIKSYEAKNKTGNKTLDIMLTAKSFQCQNLGITMTCVADGKELLFMNPMDISALFGNALDNAIEGVKKVSEPEKRLIHITVNRQKDFLRIKVENYFEGKLIIENGMPKTTKDNKEYHGYGIKSIKSIAEKYGGSLTFDAKDCWFELRVLIPIAPDK